LPDDYIERKAQLRTNILWALIFVIVAAGIGAAFFIADKKVKAAEAENRRVKDEYESEAKSIEQFSRIQTEHERLKHQAELAYSLVERVNRSNVLAELTNSLPAGVYLVDLTLDGRPRTNDPTAGMTQLQKAEAMKSGALVAAKPILYDVTLRIKGLAASNDAAAKYLVALRKSPLFLEPKLLSIDEATYKERKMRGFEYEVPLNPAADSHPIQQTTASVEAR
jgi:Tfp pilus assembly protein PilN